jgi:hypothetical protein
LEDYGKIAAWWAFKNYDDFAEEYLNFLDITDARKRKNIIEASRKDYEQRTPDENEAFLLFRNIQLSKKTREMDKLGKKFIRDKFSPEQLEEFKQEILKDLEMAQKRGQFIRKDVMQPPYEMMKFERYLKEAPVVHGIPHGASSVDVANKGVIYGWPLPYGMAGTQGSPFSMYRYKWAGYNFGYAVDSVEETGKTGDEYSLSERYQIFIKNDGVEVYQCLDREKQVIFWGKDLETEKIMPIRYYSKEAVAKIQFDNSFPGSVRESIDSEGYYLAINNGDVFSLGKDLTGAYQWLDENYDRLVRLKRIYKNHEPWPEGKADAKRAKEFLSKIKESKINKDNLEARLKALEIELLCEK